MNFWKSIVTVQTMLIFLTIGGVYNKLSINRCITFCLKIYCVTIATILVNSHLFVFFEWAHRTKIRLLSQVVLYLANVMVGICYNSESFTSVLSEIRQIDDLIQGEKVQDEIPFSRMFLIIGFSTRTLTHISFCGGLDPACIFNILVFDLALFLSHFSRIMIFESMWHRMQIICKHFEKEMSLSRMEDGEVFKQRLRNCMMIYRRLLNTIQQKNHAMKLLTFLTELTVFPMVIDILHLIFTQFGGVLNDKAPLVECLVKVTVTLAPAAFAEMANKEIDKIKLHVAKQMIYCNDQSAQEAIEDAMMFFKHHPFQYTVWRLFTVDGTLILSVVKYLTTYTLAMVQFSHILD